MKPPTYQLRRLYYQVNDAYNILLLEFLMTALLSFHYYCCVIINHEKQDSWSGLDLLFGKKWVCYVFYPRLDSEQRLPNYFFSVLVGLPLLQYVLLQCLVKTR